MNDPAIGDSHAKSMPATAKTHPLDREWLPEDPNEMFAVQLPGNPEVMLALVVEEYLRLGFAPDRILTLAADPNYRALHAAYLRWGESELRRRIESCVRRVGVFRAVTAESDPSDACGGSQLVPLTLPTPPGSSRVRKETP